MKSKLDPRHQKRVHLFQQLFAWELSRLEPSPEILYILPHIPDIDLLISAHAPKWPIDKINKADLAVLRLIVFEIKYSPNPPPVKVSIDEAIEISKEYGTDTSGSFINAVLGSIISHDQK